MGAAQKISLKICEICCNLSNVVVILKQIDANRAGLFVENDEGMIAMKRLTLLMLSVFLLTLLSMPASAESTTLTSIPDEPTEIPVYLTVNTSDMVDVTIQWDELSYQYNGKKISPGVDDMPKITVTNNNPQTTVTALPTFIPNAKLGFKETDFELNFFTEPNQTTKNGSPITAAVAVKKGTPVVFYAVPEGETLKSSVLSGTTAQQEVGAVRITIGLPESNP